MTFDKGFMNGGSGTFNFGLKTRLKRHQFDMFTLQVYMLHFTTYVTCSGKLGNMSQQQVAYLVGINSAGYFYPIQSE